MKKQTIKIFFISTLIVSLSAWSIVNAIDFGAWFGDLDTIWTSSTGVWTTINWPITGDVTIDMFTKVTKDIEVDGGSLTLGVGADIGNYKIILKNAKSLTLWVNVKVTSIEGSVETLELGTNSSVDNLSVNVTGNTNLEVNSIVKKINLKTETLDVSVNTNLKSGVIYVYKNFTWDVNSEFDGKLTVYGDTSLSVNAGVTGRYCSLWAVALGVNANLVTYNNDGLFGNIDPILAVTIDDNLTDFKTAQTTSDAFDVKFGKTMKQITTYNAQIVTLNGKLKWAKEEDRAGISSEISNVKTTKESLKQSFITEIGNTFKTLEPLIDTNTHNANLFANIQKMYIHAINLEDEGLIYAICNNSEVSGDINAVYEKGGKLHFGNKTFGRTQVLKGQQASSIISMLDKMADEKLATVNAKVDTLMENMATKGKGAKNEKQLNILMDLKELLKNELLYDE